MNEKPVLYTIEIADEAVYALAGVRPDGVYRRISVLIDFLAEHPYYGEVYEPYYESAQPPVACRILFCGKYGVYYHVDDAKKLITILTVENHRRNPLSRFENPFGTSK